MNSATLVWKYSETTNFMIWKLSTGLELEMYQEKYRILPFWLIFAVWRYSNRLFTQHIIEPILNTMPDFFQELKGRTITFMVDAE